jgi:hypothetical protein
MNTVDYHKEQIKYIQNDNLQKTREIIKMIKQSEDAGTKSLNMLDEQYEKLKRCDNLVENTNKNIETSSNILGKIKHFFFPRKACKIEKIPNDIDDNNDNNDDNIDNFDNNIDNNINKKFRKIETKSEFIDKDMESELENNIDEINIGVQNLKNIALNMNSQLDLDTKMLERVNTKSEIVNRNINKMNKEINKIL